MCFDETDEGQVLWLNPASSRLLTLVNDNGTSGDCTGYPSWLLLASLRRDVRAGSSSATHAPVFLRLRNCRRLVAGIRAVALGVGGSLRRRPGDCRTTGSPRFGSLSRRSFRAHRFSSRCDVERVRLSRGTRPHVPFGLLSSAVFFPSWAGRSIETGHFRSGYRFRSPPRPLRPPRETIPRFPY